MDYQTDIDFDTDFGYLEGIPAVFEIDLEHCLAEDFAPAETFVSARFKSMQLGNLTLRENEATAWLGPEVIQHLEGWLEETYDTQNL